MKRFFQVLIFLAIFGGVGFSVISVMQWMGGPPHFDGPSAGLKTELWKFNNTTNDFERAKIAVELKQSQQAAAAFRKQLPGQSELTPEEQATEAKALQLATQIEDQVTLFESKLTRDDIEWITKDNPDSVIRVTGEFRSHIEACTEQDYQALRSQIGLRDLQTRGMCVMALNQGYEQPFMNQYRARRLDLLQRDSRFSEYRKAGEAFYGYGRQLDKELSQDVATRVQECETELLKTGLKAEEIKPYARKLARISPRCMVSITPKFADYLKRDVTIERGRYLIDKLEQYVQMTGKPDPTLEDVPLDGQDPLYGTLEDAWHRPFELLRDGSRFKLRSIGSDSEIMIESKTQRDD